MHRRNLIGLRKKLRPCGVLADVCRSRLNASTCDPCAKVCCIQSTSSPSTTIVHVCDSTILRSKRSATATFAPRRRSFVWSTSPQRIGFACEVYTFYFGLREGAVEPEVIRHVVLLWRIRTWHPEMDIKIKKSNILYKKFKKLKN